MSDLVLNGIISSIQKKIEAISSKNDQTQKTSKNQTSANEKNNEDELVEIDCAEETKTEDTKTDLAQKAKEIDLVEEEKTSEYPRSFLLVDSSERIVRYPVEQQP